MKNDTETIEQPDHVLYGKVIGVVRQQSQIESLVKSLEMLGVEDVAAYSGASGTEQLQTWQEAVSQYFFGDMEGKMVQRYLDAVAEDFIVFAAVVEFELADRAAEIAKMHGASDVVHFGNSAVTNY